MRETMGKAKETKGQKKVAYSANAVRETAASLAPRAAGREVEHAWFGGRELAIHCYSWTHARG